MSSQSNENVILVVLQDGDTKRKLRFCFADPSHVTCKILLDRICETVSVKDVKVDVYNPMLDEFVDLASANFPATQLGTRLHCVLHRPTADSSDGQQLLSIQGRFFEYNNGTMIGGKQLEVHEMPNTLGAGTGLNVWDGAVLLAKYLEHKPELVSGKSCLELGSGSGLVGIAAHVLGSTKSILTDLPYTMDLLRQNIALNIDSKLGDVSCRVCDWFNPPSFEEDDWRSNVILIADCVWVEELVSPLLRTINSLLVAMEGDVVVLISYQRRGKVAHDLFWTGMKSMFRTVEVANFLPNKPDSLNVYQCHNRTT